MWPIPLILPWLKTKIVLIFTHDITIKEGLEPTHIVELEKELHSEMLKSGTTTLSNTSITTFSIMTLSITTFSIRTLSITTFSLMTLSITINET